jgi:hydroxymethylpyrimidine/phosphomethylpyrimidine kinase
MARTPVCISIAGSDSGGGAGIQADLKAFARCGVHGTTAITAITAQNTVGVERIDAVAPDMIVAQIKAVAQDMGIDAVKVGMLGDADTISIVARAIEEFAAGKPVVVDPVMVAESGARLLESGAENALRTLLLPLATVVTPNVPEAHVLAARDKLDGEQLAREVQAIGAKAVILTGGHRAQAVDIVFDGETVTEIPGERFPGGAAHGSGCTHSSVVAAQLALGKGLVPAARIARRYAGEAVRDGLRDVGKGAGPVDILNIRERSPGR